VGDQVYELTSMSNRQRAAGNDQKICLFVETVARKCLVVTKTASMPGSDPLVLSY